VVSPESWKLIFDKVDALPSSVRHIVVMTTIPVVYPKVRTTCSEVETDAAMLA
jgi:hypothetical protein